MKLKLQAKWAKRELVTTAMHKQEFLQYLEQYHSFNSFYPQYTFLCLLLLFLSVVSGLITFWSFGCAVNVVPLQTKVWFRGKNWTNLLFKWSANIDLCWWTPILLSLFQIPRDRLLSLHLWRDKDRSQQENSFWIHSKIHVGDQKCILSCQSDLFLHINIA